MNEIARFKPLPSPVVGIEFGQTSAKVIEPRLTIEEIGAMIDQATMMGDSVRWWVGDLLLYAESRWGEQSAQLLNTMRLSERQATNYRWVAEKVAPSLRRENLSFTHHEIVAAMPPVEQERLLATAEAGELSVHVFREKVRDQKALNATPPSRIIVDAPSSTVDAARGLRTARATLRTVATGAPTASDTLRIPEAIRGVDDAAKALSRIGLLEDVLAAAAAVLASGVVQIGLPDPAVIVPSGAWDKLYDAHTRATEGRNT